ncbi:MAG: CDP-diacylglycerol--serine O-phosphatidyltransferase [Porphyromonadaceae bacterium]|nr:CDP-diacylglycerol--serine O-phosphatidyltransferase [Porphyromonadaceae bacterium]
MENNDIQPGKQFWGIKHLPNAITCLNLFSGCCGVWLAFKGYYVGATVAILLSAFFDFLDGMVARLVNAFSELGKQLDSLADVVSFGLVPGAMIFSMLSTDGAVRHYTFLAFLIPVFSALRLAKFNIDTRQTTTFIGLPTPANAIFWGGIGVSFSAWFSENPIALIALTGIFSFLLVSEISMFALKFKNFSLKENRLQYIFLGVCLLLIIILHQDAIAPIIMWYIVLSMVQKFTSKTPGKEIQKGK